MSKILCTARHDSKGLLSIEASWDPGTRLYRVEVWDRFDVPVWSSDGLTDEDCRNTHVIALALHTLGVTPPAGFWPRMERKEGNVVYHFDPENPDRWTCRR